MRWLHRFRRSGGATSAFPLGALLVAASLACGDEGAIPGSAPAADAQRMQPAGVRGENMTAGEARACSVGSSQQDLALAQALVERVNQLRATGADCGRTGEFAASVRLAPSAQLQCVAELQAADMAQRGFFSHVNPDGRDAEQRASALGFHGAVGENLAWGQTTPEEVVAAWLRSPDHCKAMLQPDYALTGAGYRRTAAGRTLWVHVSGTR
jgi:uncharacterized protein YkwD